MRQVNLGSQGLVVSAQGLGCMGMSTTYGPSDEQENLGTLARALELGVTLFDSLLDELREHWIIHIPPGEDRSAGSDCQKVAVQPEAVAGVTTSSKMLAPETFPHSVHRAKRLRVVQVHTSRHGLAHVQLT